ncbi:hypothetical protein D3C81_1890060 [compost metagenome]
MLARRQVVRPRIEEQRDGVAADKAQRIPLHDQRAALMQQAHAGGMVEIVLQHAGEADLVPMFDIGRGAVRGLQGQ